MVIMKYSYILCPAPVENLEKSNHLKGLIDDTLEFCCVC